MHINRSHNWINLLLALAVVFAPLQASVAAIDMLDHGKPMKQHCKMMMDDHAAQDEDSQKDCCKNGFGCGKCLSVHAMVVSQPGTANPPVRSFDQFYPVTAWRLPVQHHFRPPRSLS